MTVISDLLRTRIWRHPKNEDWVLEEDDALLEAQVIDVRLDAINSTVGILIDLRTSLQLAESNTGVLVVDSVTRLQWAAGTTLSGRTAWTVVGSEIRSIGKGVEILLRLHPNCELTVRGVSAVLHAVEVPDLDMIPDLLSDTDDEIQRMTANWESTGQVSRTTTLSGAGT
ncbi:hypothetical protein [Microbacterium sp. K27]|uniref:hypothetical protein n=1 Tax=Microbacterium sp. K27 TaxID=2305445 RepID=UPI00109B8A39|nr:hypothetical protein [Microbacterium sp. K27]